MGEVTVLSSTRARRPEAPGEIGGDVGVVVCAIPESETLREPDRVRTAQRNQVLSVEPLLLERVDQRRQVHVRRRKVVVGCCPTRRGRVPPSKLYFP